MRNAVAYLMIACVCGAFVGLWIIGLPEKHPKVRPDDHIPEPKKLTIDAEQDRMIANMDARLRKLESNSK